MRQLSNEQAEDTAFKYYVCDVYFKDLDSFEISCLLFINLKSILSKRTWFLWFQYVLLPFVFNSHDLKNWGGGGGGAGDFFFFENWRFWTGVFLYAGSSFVLVNTVFISLRYREPFLRNKWCLAVKELWLHDHVVPVVLERFSSLFSCRWSVAFVTWPTLWLRVRQVQEKRCLWYVHLLRGREQSTVSSETKLY
jgi:hypothetical protein